MIGARPRPLRFCRVSLQPKSQRWQPWMLSREPATDKVWKHLDALVRTPWYSGLWSWRGTWAEAERSSVRSRTTGGARPSRSRYKPGFKRPKDPAGRKTFPLASRCYDHRAHRRVLQTTESLTLNIEKALCTARLCWSNSRAGRVPGQREH